MSDNDGGMKSCFLLCNVDPKIMQLVDAEGFANLTEFIHGFRSHHWETELAAFHDTVDQKLGIVSELVGKRVSQARLKAAYSTGKEALAHFNKTQAVEAEQTPATAADWELPLPDADKEEMEEKFDKSYDFKIDCQLFPCDPLQNQCWREFRRWSMTVIEVGKLKSMLMQKSGTISNTHQLMPNVDITYSAAPNFVPHTVVDYYWGLRVLAYAWAKAGNYEVRSVIKEGSLVKMMPLDVALDYADRALRVTMSCGIPWQEQLDWMERKDRTTRAVMAGLVRRKYPAQEALKQALVETASDWTVVKGGEVRGVHDSIAQVDGGQSRGRSDNADKALPWKRNAGGKASGDKDSKGKGKGKDKDRKKPIVQSKIGKLASITRKGEKLCDSFNSSRGCKFSEWKCPQRAFHRCGFLVDDNGTVCYATNHGYAGHKV